MSRMDWDRAKRDHVIGQRKNEQRAAMLARPDRPYVPKLKRTDPVAVAAIDFARSYQGSLPFMVAMAANATDPKWVPNARQARGILNCKAISEGRTPSYQTKRQRAEKAKSEKRSQGRRRRRRAAS